jgi:hypothetical protein
VVSHEEFNLAQYPDTHAFQNLSPSVTESIDCAEALEALCYQPRRSTAEIAVREDKDEDKDNMPTVSWRFTEALALARRRTASDRRHKIFGLLGLSPSRLSHEIAVTYRSSTRQVFLTTAFYLIEATKSFALFGFLGDSVPINPSWIPFDDRGYATQYQIGLRRAQERIFTAGGDQGWVLSRPGPYKLRARGVRLDKIVSCYSTRIEHRLNILYWADALLPYLREIRQPLRGQHADGGDPSQDQTIIYATLDRPIEAILRTIMKDSAPATGPGGFHKLSLADLLPLEQWLVSAWDSLTHLGDRSFDQVRQELIGQTDPLTFQDSQSMRVDEHVLSVTDAHNLAITRLGYTVLVPSRNCFPGDEVWLLAGASHPLILEPKKPGRFRVRNVVYVHGVMYGEAVRGECPILSANDDIDEVLRDIDAGRKEWPTPVFEGIELH